MREEDRSFFDKLREPLVAGSVLAALTLLFWKVRIIDLAVPRITIVTGDLYRYHYPMKRYGFASLGEGHLPFWNPYQLCGEPFLAMPSVGLFYPFNLIYLLIDTAPAIEVAFILHMLFGAISMWCLLRHFGIGTLGALCSAVTFVWSGWLIANANWPTIFYGLTWMPLTILLLDRVALGSKLARLALIFTVAFQIFLGATEILLHTMYLGALFTLGRLMPLAWRGAWKTAVQRGCVIMACIAAAVLLAAPQLFVTLEAVALSVRAAGSLTFEQARIGNIPPLQFLKSALWSSGRSYVWVGLFPLLGTILALGWRRHRMLWCCALVAVSGAALLTFGGFIFRLYYNLPWGSLFRRPMKFADIYVFGQAILAGVAFARLESWAGWTRRRLWCHPCWLSALGLGAALLLGLPAFLPRDAAWSSILDINRIYWSWRSVLAITLLLLVLFGGLTSVRWRLRLLTALLVVQTASLFSTSANRLMRPWQWPEVLETSNEITTFLRTRPSYDRAYLFQSGIGLPRGVEVRNLRQKAAMLNRFNSATDEEPMLPRRYASFFSFVSRTPPSPNMWVRLQPFLGFYDLGPQARWRVMDLTGTRYFVAGRGEVSDAFMASGPRSREFQLIRDGPLRVYERGNALPRAYFVPRARVVRDPERVLVSLDDPSFDPRAEVLLEDARAELTSKTSSARASTSVRITRYDPEHVAIAVDGTADGFLVLTDLFYPGWKALVDDRDVPIYRANYLFRAVRLTPGRHTVDFRYDRRTFRIGLIMSAITVSVIGLILMRALRPGLPAAARARVRRFSRRGPGGAGSRPSQEV